MAATNEVAVSTNVKIHGKKKKKNRLRKTTGMQSPAPLPDSTSRKVIKEVLSKQNITRDRDVEELYIAHRNLTDVSSLQQFRFLTVLWLNNNKLRKLTCLRNCWRLRELYLHNNKLRDIHGTVGHLASLEVLMLQNNQLTNLEIVILELKKLLKLQILNLFNNPLSLEADYRYFVVHNLPQVDILDRHVVLPDERAKAEKAVGQLAKVKESIAFGRRSPGPPPVYRSVSPRVFSSKLDSEDKGHNFLKNLPAKQVQKCFTTRVYKDPVYGSLEEAYEARRKSRVVTVFSFLDWSKLPKLEERRVTKTPFEAPQMITYVYR